MTNVQPVIVALNPMPPGGQLSFFERPGGVRLRYGLWPAPAAAPAKGTMIVVPGRTEFLEKYFEVVGELQARNYAVAVLDVRGQGRSTRPLPAPLKGHVDAFQDYIDDLEAWISHIVTDRLPPPYRVLAHSMGGAITLGHCHDYPGKVERAVMIAPMVRLKAGVLPYPAAVFMIRAARRLFGAAASTGSGPRSDPVAMSFARNVVTHDRARFEREQELLKTAPDLALGAPTLGWISQAAHIAEKLADIDYVRAIKIPILIFRAGEDRLIDAAAQIRLAETLPAGKMITIDGAHHEILMETDARRTVFWAAFDSFMDP